MTITVKIRYEKTPNDAVHIGYSVPEKMELTAFLQTIAEDKDIFGANKIIVESLDLPKPVEF